MIHSYRVLHVGGTAAEAGAVRGALCGRAGGAFDLEWVRTLPEALHALAFGDVGAVLLTVSASHREDLETLEQLRQAAHATPILVLGPEEDDAFNASVAAAGAHLYLSLNHLDSYWLPLAVRRAIECSSSEETLRLERDDARVALDSIGDALISTNTSGRVLYLNTIAEKMTGWSRAEAAGQSIDAVMQLVEADSREPATLAIRQPQSASGAHPVSTYVLLRHDGTESTVECVAAAAHNGQGRTLGMTLVLRDVSDARAISARVSYLASHDVLTGLPNRLLLGDRLARALSLARRHSRRLAVLFLDIDRFKHINDSLGHTVGDELLRSIARTLSTCVRSSDTVSRQGGDEFVVVLSELEQVEQAARGAQHIMNALAKAHHMAGLELHVTASVGISVYPDDGDDAETLLTRADMALYHAKDEGRDCYRFFESRLNARAVERQTIEASLHHALARREFELFFQPKVHLDTNAIVGIEALIRWRHPERGLIAPAQFVSIAEDCGLIKPIGFWVLREVCRQANAWQTAGVPPVSIAVNISAIEFRHEGFLPHLADVLRETGIDPRQLEIELTESTLMSHVDRATDVMHSLKALGVRLAIDDFGTGWSSLSYLRHFPIDALKIDKSFVQEMADGSDAASIVRAIIAMGKSLKHRVIAEGVETAAQLAFLQDEGCDEAQGYYLSRPVSADECATFLRCGALPHLPRRLATDGLRPPLPANGVARDSTHPGWPAQQRHHEH